jgi:3-oxoacyl-[acyl-carrier protein] reductase
MADGLNAKSLFDLSGRTIIVTGGAVGIGKIYSRALAEVGANVVIADITDNEGGALAGEITDAGGKAVYVSTDVSNMAACEALAAAAIENFGTIDGLVNNAAMYSVIPKRNDWTTIPEDEWDQLMAVNLKGIFNCCKAAHPAMKKQGYGKIINISSSTWLTGTTGRLHYTTSKAGVVGLTKSETIAAAMPEAHWEARERKMADSAAIPRMQMPEDLVGTILFLLAPASDYVTGQTIACEGGSNHL